VGGSCAAFVLALLFRVRLKSGWQLSSAASGHSLLLRVRLKSGRQMEPGFDVNKDLEARSKLYPDMYAFASAERWSLAYCGRIQLGSQVVTRKG
jgi:hypothetical protein